MKETWRWFGSADPVTLDDVRQTGAAGVVTALHHIPVGEVWPADEIARRKQVVELSGLDWSVVESIPVHPSIKQGAPNSSRFVDAWIATMRNLASAGVTTICYNFMPVIDWTRTDLRYQTPSGGLALRFDPVDVAAYDLFVLRRKKAHADYPESLAAAAETRLAEMDADAVLTLENTVIAGLPGSEASHGRAGFRAALEAYDNLSEDALRANLMSFLTRVVPAAEDCGVRICLHPDDPPMPLFGLPRVVSTAEDYDRIFAAVPQCCNGVTFCAGSLASRADNDVIEMARNLAPRIHFAHLRNVRRETTGAFYESDHLQGEVDMVRLASVLLDEEARRRAEERPDADIPFRPDHGHLLLDDVGKKTNPGYSAIGRLKGLAELRGVIRVLAHA